jgi:hypothetical protein
MLFETYESSNGKRQQSSRYKQTIRNSIICPFSSRRAPARSNVPLRENALVEIISLPGVPFVEDTH